MIAFECPSCKAKLQVADEHAGRTIQCPSCNGMAAAPVSAETAAQAIAPAPAAAPPPPAPTAVTTPDNIERRRPGEPDDRPRRRGDTGTAAMAAGVGVAAGTGAAAGKGMGTGAIIMIILGVGGCCALGVVAILVALLVPAVQKVREAAARTQSINNLKQIGLGFHSHHDTFKRLPFNGADGEQPLGGDRKKALPGASNSGSWAFQILPFLDQTPMFQRADRTQPVQAYLCPGRGRPPLEAGGGAWTDYFYNNYLNDPDQAARPDAPRRLGKISGITDGTSNTVMIGHGNISRAQYLQTGNVTMSSNIFDGGTFGTARAGNNGKTRPTGVILRRDDDTPPTFATWGGPFPQGALMCMGDGTVRIFPYTTPEFNAMLTPAGDEAVMIPN